MQICAGEKTIYLFRETEEAKNAGGHQPGSSYLKPSRDFLVVITSTYQFQEFKFWMASFLHNHYLNLANPKKGDTHDPASSLLPPPLHFHFLFGF